MGAAVHASPVGRRLRVGMVGGGRGAFIGAVHRMAVELDGEAQVVAGALSSDADTAAGSAAAWHLDRSYDSWAQMARAEGSDAQGIDFVICATPNHLHLPVARAFLEAGIAVVCDKPLALTVAEGEALARLVAASGRPFALTHTYAGYPAVRHARELVRSGKLGALRKVLVDYSQDWLREPIEQAGQRQASWRTDPARAGAGGSIGDIGTHAFHLLEFVSGLRVTELAADLTSFVPGRRLDDDANLLLRLAGAARGILTCSQIACGEENRLTLRLYGTRGGLEWSQEEPNTLLWKPAGEPWVRLRAGQGSLSAAAQRATRLPPGHPEGYIEALANLYRAFIEDLRRMHAGATPVLDYPTVGDGVRGLQFIEQAVASARSGASWVRLPQDAGP